MYQKKTNAERFKEKAENYTNKAISQLDKIKKMASSNNRISQSMVYTMLNDIQESIYRNRELFNRAYITRDMICMINYWCSNHYKNKGCRLSFNKIDSFETLKSMTLLVDNPCKRVGDDFMALYSLDGVTVYSTQDIFMEKDSACMFMGCQFSYIDLRNVNTSCVTNMHCMFRDCEAKGINLSQFDTSKVADMSSMFEGCKVKILDLSCFDTSNVENMSGMFKDCIVSSLNLDGFITKKVEDMSYMFCNCKAKNIDVHSFDTSLVEDMQSMFEECEADGLDLRNFKFKNVTDMFHGCRACITGNIVLGDGFMKALAESEVY